MLEGVAEASQIFRRDTYILLKWVSYEKYYIRDRWYLIAIGSQSMSGDSGVISFYDIHGRKGELLFCSILNTTRELLTFYTVIIID
jgi:hypothetical protein